MSIKSVTVRIPATSANLGSGFDSLGIALGLYNYVTIKKSDSGLKIRTSGGLTGGIPLDRTNLVYRAASVVANASGNDSEGIELVLRNNIPASRGLGSSSAAIVGGLTAANSLYGTPFTKQQLLNFAAELEGHADNVAPAIYGGFTTAVPRASSVSCISNPLRDDIKFAVFIPDFYLKTKRSRNVLPRFVPFRDAVFNTGRSALLTACLISGDYTHLRTAVSDRLHQNYRKRLIPGIDEIFRLSYKNNALGVYLSGAGPTILAIIKSDNNDFNAKVSGVLNKKLTHWHLQILNADNEGASQINRLEVF